jgi:hypothetical protein
MVNSGRAVVDPWWAHGALTSPRGVTRRSLLDFNARANFGGGRLTTGFTPDPWTVSPHRGRRPQPRQRRDLNIVDA